MAVNERKLAAAYARGLKREKAGDAVGAAEAYRECLALDPDDRGGVSIRLASLGLGAAPDKAPPAYVATLFDQHAHVFDSILVEQLGYAVPMQLRAEIDSRGLGPFARMLDLGCGTGLAGMAMRDAAAHVTGVDLSELILGEADERGTYDDLYVGDAVAFAAEWDEEKFDLVTATDMLPYLGDLAPLAAAIADCSAPGAIVGLSSETLPAAAFGASGYAVGPHQRFHHEPAHVEGLFADAGFSLVSRTDIIVRTDEGVPQPGHLFLFRKGR